MEVQQKPKRKPRKQTAKKSAKQVDISQRRWLVLELRKQGATYREIAEQLVETFGGTGEHGITKKYDHTLAYKDFKDVLAELNERNIDELEENRRLDLERLDNLLAGFFDKATTGDPFAFDKAMDVIKQRAMMFGYNAPAKVDHTSSDGSMTPPTAIQIIPYVSSDSDTA